MLCKRSEDAVKMFTIQVKKKKRLGSEQIIPLEQSRAGTGGTWITRSREAGVQNVAMEISKILKHIVAPSKTI
jgi:hypothetical protein